MLVLATTFIFYFVALCRSVWTLILDFNFLCGRCYVFVFIFMYSVRVVESTFKTSLTSKIVEKIVWRPQTPRKSNGNNSI